MTSVPSAPLILVAEDDPDLRDLFELILTAGGLSVRCVEDGRAAWSALPLLRPDAVMTDLVMPRMDGLDLAVRMRQSETWKRLPILIVTAVSSSDVRLMQAARLERVWIRQKPMAPQEMTLVCGVLAHGGDPDIADAQLTASPAHRVATPDLADAG